ncbi:MAG: OmpA family protein [Saprospiraceae bacterium]
MGKTLLVLSVFAVWCFVCQQWYVCGIKQACASAIGQSTPTKTVTISPTEPTTSTNLPIAFRWQSAEPLLGTNYAQYRDSIIRELGEEDILQITALYYHTENSPTDSITYGAERARALKRLFAEQLPANRIQLRQKSIRLADGIKNHPFSAMKIEYLAPPEDVNKSAAPVVKMKDGVRIYFGFNASEGEMDLEIENYLNQLADSLVLRGETVRITGHTDNIGEAKANYNIGLRRAKSVRNYLRNKGVPRSQIQTFSKGETEPIATNETEEGMARNRRTEIKIIK